jgi:hypothetical protein
VNDGQELANEIIKKNEKDTHEAQEEARRAEEAAERERHIGICRRFEPGGGGVPGPTSKLSPRAPAQMGRRETEREGGKKPEGDRRER